MFNKISMRTLIAPAAAVCMLLSGTAIAGDWQRVAPAGAGFAVMMPSAPQSMDQTVQTHFGPRVMHVYAVESAKAAYMVAFTDYKAQLPDPRKGLDEVRDGQVGTGKMIAEENVTAGGYPGKRVLIQTADGKTMVTQMFLVGTKLYQAIYVTMAGQQEALQAAGPFMKSFQLQ